MPRRDYREGKPGFGCAPPEGIVYFDEVLGYYLQHRPAARLLAEPKPDEPLGLVLARAPQEGTMNRASPSSWSRLPPRR